MNKITVLDLLKKYKNWMEKDEIQFLQKESFEYKNITKSIDKLIEAFDEAGKAKGVELSDNLDWHNVHKLGKNLWCDLISSCVKNIDSTAKGNSRLYAYIEKATAFEDLLYGLEDYYRDHTLHSLWVYFIGEYIMREKLQKLHNNLFWYLYNEIEKKDKLYSDSIEKITKIHKQVNKMRDAIWCLIALCHDLGYSLSKLNMLNQKVKDVLDFFDLENFNQVGYHLNIEQQYNMSLFLELVAMEVRIVPDKDEKEAQIKCYRDDSTYWRLCRALEKKQHGILSAYLIYKVLGIFADLWVRGSAEEWGLEEDEAADNIIRGDILFAIAQHEFDFAHLNSLGGVAEILILSDELEEFSRFGRQLLSRKYHDTMAHSDIEFEIDKDEVAITFHYEVAEHRDLGDFFCIKAEKLAQVFSLTLDKTYASPNSYQIRKIIMEAHKGADKFVIEMTKTGDHKGNLPDFEKYKRGEYNLQCKDDKITVIPDKDEPVLLENWMNGFDNEWRKKK